MKRLGLSGFAVAAALVLSGCASVDMASKEESAEAKQFKPPAAGQAGLYIYRNSFGGQALKKDLWVDRKCIGETANNVFFYTQLPGDQTYELATESEFSPNRQKATLAAGKNHFFRQYIKLGVFVGGANIEAMSEEQGKKDVAKLDMAKMGTCSGKK